MYDNPTKVDLQILEIESVLSLHWIVAVAYCYGIFIHQCFVQ